MKATEANNSSDDKNIDLLNQQLKRIYNSINAAIKKGAYETMIFETILLDNQTLLKDDGYNLDERGGRMGENNWWINWDGVEEPVIDNSQSNTYYPGGITPEQPPL